MDSTTEPTGYLDIRAWTSTLDGGDESLASLIADTELLRELETAVAKAVAYYLLLNQSQVTVESQFFEDAHPCKHGGTPPPFGDGKCGEPTTRQRRLPLGGHVRVCSAGHEQASPQS